VTTIKVEIYFKAVPAIATDGSFGVKLLPRVKNFAALRANLSALPVIYLERYARNGATKLGSFKTHDASAPVFKTMQGANEYMTRITKEINDGVAANAKTTTSTATTREWVTKTITVKPTVSASIN